MKNNLAGKAIPAAVRQILIKLGRNIRIARLRRRLRLEDVAQRVGVSRYLISEVEKGKPTTSIATYITTLWALGLEVEMHGIADPDHDEEGKTLELIHSPTTAPKRRKVLDNDF